MTDKEKVIIKLVKEILDGKFTEIMGNIEEALRRIARTRFSNDQRTEPEELTYQANEIKELIRQMNQRTVWTVLKL